MLWEEALIDAQKAIDLDPSSYHGYQLKYTALRGAQRHDEAIEAFQTMLSKMSDAADPQIRKLREQYITSSEAASAIQEVIHAQLENFPHRSFNTITGLLCDREAQISAFTTSTEYERLLWSTMKHGNLRMEPIKDVVAMYFRLVMLSHRWEKREPLLRDIRDKVIYELDPISGIVKLQSFCKVARDAGYRWAWIDTCCIDQNNNVEIQESVNSMFVWYRHSALTIVYLSDVPPLSKSGALAESVWNTRGWTLGELLAAKVVLFYQKDWTLYLDDRSVNHKESVSIMQELEDATGIDAQALVAFHPGMRAAREKLQWASTRVTTLQEDIAYSLFGIFGIHLPVIYGEKRQHALGRLLKEIVSRSGDITALDWVGKPSEFNSYLPADISSYRDPPYMPPSLSEDAVQTSVSSLRNVVAVEMALKLYSMLNHMSAPRFSYTRLQLPCFAFPVTEVRRRHDQAQRPHSTFTVKANGLKDLLITTEDRLIQFSQEKPIAQAFLLVYPWCRDLLELPEVVESLEDRSPAECDESESYLRGLRLMVRLGQPFSAFLLALQGGGEYKRIASDQNIIAQVKDFSSIQDMMDDIEILEILCL